MIQIVVLNSKGCFHPPGHPTGLHAHNIESVFGRLDDILKLLGPDEWKNVFYTIAHHSPLGQQRPSRTAATFESLKILPFDIDHVDPNRWQEYLAVTAKVLHVSPEDLVVVNSGNGLHILAHLERPVRSIKHLRELKPAYNELVRKIAGGMREAQLPGNPDPVIWEPGRILRLPGTLNSKLDSRKLETVRPCTLLQNTDKRQDIDMHVLAGLDRLARENISPEQVRRQYPLPDFPEMARECGFVSWCLEHPEQVHEPHFFSLISLLSAQAPARKIVFQDREFTAREVGQYVYEKAVNSKSLAAQDFDKKWEDGARYGAQKCTTVGQVWIGGCEKCRHFGKLPTPLALKSKSHISSAETGYWVLGKNGQHLYPNYGDVTKLYTQERPYIATPAKQLWVFDRTHYKVEHELQVKAWIERKMVPNDPVLSNHRSEFYQKVLVAGSVSEDDEQALFMKSIEGRLNFRNGLMDVRKAEFLPHSHSYGFRYVLPYDYLTDAGSEYFLEWLSYVMEDRVELMEAVLDLMAYCLWPDYDSHVFTYFVGEGGNGKSTLLEVIQALVGEKNFSSVSLSQLATNRFASAQLEGKLVNLCEESSGGMISYEEMNVIKDLSAGGTITVERKGQQQFDMRNRAKLIFSANKVPQFRDQGHNIKRRMLVIPFDRVFAVEDPTVKDRLLAEVPEICSMLVRRIQANIKSNNGKFKVSRGGVSGAEAQERVLLAGNSAAEWAKENIESNLDCGEDAFISSKDAYAHYKNWCLASSYPPMNVGAFGHIMTKSLLSHSCQGKTAVKRIGGRPVRGFTFTRWKEEAKEL